MSMTSELVQELRRLAKSHCFYGGGCTLEMAANTIEELSAKLAAANMERSSVYYNGGWIPVSERLPDIRKDCLVTVRYTGSLGMYGIWVKTGHLESDGDWWGDCMGGKVIAWMPLPEPYKAE